eukprot:gene31348-40731_t
MAAKIKDGLFVGDEDTSMSEVFINDNKISNLINLSGREVQNVWASHGLVYLTYYWEDRADYKLFSSHEDPILTDIVEFIDTYDFVFSKKPDLDLNKGFIQQMFALDMKMLAARQRKGPNLANGAPFRIEANMTIADIAAMLPSPEAKRWNGWEADYITLTSASKPPRSINNAADVGDESDNNGLDTSLTYRTKNTGNRIPRAILKVGGKVGGQMLAYPGCSVVNHATLTYNNSTNMAPPKNNGYFGSGSPSAAKTTPSTSTATSTSTRPLNGINMGAAAKAESSSNIMNTIEGNSEAKRQPTLSAEDRLRNLMDSMQKTTISAPGPKPSQSNTRAQTPPVRSQTASAVSPLDSTNPNLSLYDLANLTVQPGLGLGFGSAEKNREREKEKDLKYESKDNLTYRNNNGVNPNLNASALGLGSISSFNEDLDLDNDPLAAFEPGPITQSQVRSTRSQIPTPSVNPTSSTRGGAVKARHDVTLTNSNANPTYPSTTKTAWGSNPNPRPASPIFNTRSSSNPGSGSGTGSRIYRHGSPAPNSRPNLGSKTGSNASGNALSSSLQRTMSNSSLNSNASDYNNNNNSSTNNTSNRVKLRFLECEPNRSLETIQQSVNPTQPCIEPRFSTPTPQSSQHHDYEVQSVQSNGSNPLNSTNPNPNSHMTGNNNNNNNSSGYNSAGGVRSTRSSTPTKEFGIIVAPEYFWGNKATLTEAQCNYIINSLVNLARNNVRILFVVGTISYVSDEMIQNRHAVRNVAPIIYHQYNEYGILQLQRCLYYKVNPFKEVSNQGTQYFVPGPPFTHSYPWKVGPRSGRVLNFSVEICMDHASAAACTAIQENAQQNVFMLHPSMLSLGESKDFSIVVSDFCENLAGNKIYEMVRKPTNFIHSSTVLLYRKDIISNYVKIINLLR